MAKLGWRIRSTLMVHIGSWEIEGFRVSNRTARRLVINSRLPDKGVLILTPFQEIVIPLRLEQTLQFGDWSERNFVVKKEIKVLRGGTWGLRHATIILSGIWDRIRKIDVTQTILLALDFLFWGLILVVCATCSLIAFGSTSAPCFGTPQASILAGVQGCAAQYHGIKPIFSATWTFAAAALPSTLYFIFERQQAAILKRKFYREVLFLGSVYR